MEAAAMKATASLRRWLRLYADREADGVGCSASRTVRRVLQSALPMAFAKVSRGAENDWQDVLKALEAFYEAPLGVDVDALPHIESNDAECASPTFYRLLELVLGAVVQSEEKAAFVQDILAMDASVQVDLMAVIEKVIAHGVDTPSTGPESQDDEAGGEEAAAPSTPVAVERSSRPGSTASTPGFRSPLHLSINADFDRVKRENAVLRDENVHITENLDTARQQLQRREAENEALTSQIQELMQDNARDLLRKEHSVRMLFDDRIQQMQRRLEAVTAELHEKSAIASAIPTLRDEIDLLRPSAERVSKMDGKIAKYKAKIEDLAAVKNKLRSVERVNDELMAQNLVLESRVSKSASLQRKLDEAKDTNTSLEFRVSELESLLTRQAYDLEALRNDLEASGSALQEAKTHNQQLQETIACQLNGSAVSQSDSLVDGASTAITGGISELNPELMQKLQRLEFENDELKTRVDEETSERVDSLLDQVADLTRLKKSFETRYFDTLWQLEETQAHLKKVKASEADVAVKLASTEEKLHSVTLLLDASNDALTTARGSIDELHQSVARQQDELIQRRHTEAALQAQLGCRDQVVEELNATIQRLQQTVSTLRERQGILLEDVESYGVERRISLDERVGMMNIIQQLQADAADLQQRLVVEEEDNSSLRQHREALCMATEDLEAHLLLERRRINNQRTELAIMADSHEKAVADLERRLVTAANQLLEQRETTIMQLEDAGSARERLLQLVECERLAQSKRFSDAITTTEEHQQRLVRECDAKLAVMTRDHSDAICRMTDTIDAKSSALETATQSLSEYKRMHSVSNDEWKQRERTLEAEVEQSRQLLAAQDAKQAELSAALYVHEERKLRLAETNLALEAEVTKKNARVEKLEAAMSRQESTIAVLEKERVLHSRQEEHQRDKESVSATFSAQQHSQIDGLAAELKELTRKHQALQIELQACKCDRRGGGVKDGNDARAVMLSPDEKKDYCRSRIRHLEQNAQQQDDKRRELLLVNAKLVQEQKQLHIQNAKLAIEMQKIKEKLARSLLRDSAQSPQHKKRVQAKEALATHRVMQRSGGRTGAELDGVVLYQGHAQLAQASAHPAVKRQKLGELAVTNEIQPKTSPDNASLSLTASSVQPRADLASSDAAETATAPRSKHRRLAHFFADNIPSAASTAPTDAKPAECNQQ